MAAAKKKGGGMSGMRRALKKVATAVGTGGMIMIPAATVGFSIKRAVDAGRFVEHSLIDHMTGFSITDNEFKIERLYPLIAGVAGGIVWKKIWSFIGRRA